MKTGFVILNYNCGELTKNLATKIMHYNLIDHIVVVDNTSTDNSADILASLGEGACFIKSDKNGGYSYGNNIGIKKCESLGDDIIFVANPDVDIQKKDLQEMILAFNESDYNILSCIEYNIDDNISTPALWKKTSYMDDLLDCFILGRKISGSKGIPVDYSKKIQEVPIIKGSFWAGKTEFLKKIDYLDDKVFLFCEERILSYKTLTAGGKIGVLTGCKYNHNHSASINNEYKKKEVQIKKQFESRIYYHKTYPETNKLLLAILRISMKFSLFEYRLWFKIKK